MNRRSCSIIILSIILSTPCFSKTDDTAHTLQLNQKKSYLTGFFALSVNLFLGKAHEYVLQDHNLLSHLEWQMKPVVSYTAQAEMLLFNILHFQTIAELVQPMPSGSMIDKDFKNIPRNSNLTHLSKHSCNLKEGSRITAAIGIPSLLPQTSKMEKKGISMSLEPMIGLHYSNLQWEAVNGYNQYGNKNPDGSYTEWNEHIEKKAIHGTVVSYRQALLVPTLGIGVGITLPHRLTIFSNVHISPQVISTCEDTHYDRNITFIDRTNHGWAVYSKTQVLWQLAHFFGLVSSFRYEKALGWNGSTIIEKKNKAPERLRSKAGTELEACTFSIGFAFIFGR